MEGSGNVISRPAPPGARRRGGANANLSGGNATPAASRSQATSPVPPEEPARTTEVSAPVSAAPPTGEISMADMEAALSDMTRDDLVVALKRSKEHMDELNARLEEQLLTLEEHQASLADARTRIETVEAEGATLQSAVARREERIDELLAEQQRADNEVGTLQNENQRLTRENLEAERARREADRRLEEQMANAEKERQFFSDTEALLNSQRAKSVAANERLMATNAELKREAEVLQKQLEEQTFSPAAAAAPRSAGLVAASDAAFAGQADQSQTALLATLEQLQAEMRDLKASNSTLRSENESYLAVINEKTLSEAQAAENAVLDLGVDDEDDDDSGAGENSNGDVADVPPTRRRARRQPSSPGKDATGSTLGDELDERNRRSREGSEEMSNDLATLQREVRELREANKTLSVYFARRRDADATREKLSAARKLIKEQDRRLKASPGDAATAPLVTALQQEVQSLRRELRLVASAYHEQGLALLRAKSNAASILTAPGAQPTPVSWLVQQRRVHGGLSVLRRT